MLQVAETTHTNLISFNVCAMLLQIVTQVVGNNNVANYLFIVMVLMKLHDRWKGKVYMCAIKP